MTIQRSGLGLLLLALLLSGCGDSTSAPVPSRVVVTPPSVTLDALGETQQFSVRVEDKKGSEVAGVPVTWSSSNEAVASVTSSGLVTALKQGSASIRATADGLTGSAGLTVSPAPTEVSKTAGDTQVGALSQPLALQPQVEVKDKNGNPIPGISVTFSVLAGEGSASPATVATDANGRASTIWTLGCSNASPQRLAAYASGLSTEFTATADLSLPAICQTTVPEGRETHPYQTTLQVAGGDPSTMAWSVVSGTLPPGLTLQANGALGGTPTLAGSYPFRAKAQDAQARSASRDFTLRVCEAPLSLPPGGVATRDPSGTDGCGFFLPAGSNGNRYRVAVVYSSTSADSLNVSTVNVSLAKTLAGAAVAETQPPAGAFRLSSNLPAPASALDGSLRLAVETDRATEAFHHRLRLAERELIRSLGPNARPLPDTRPLLRASGAEPASSPDKMSFTNPADFTSCTLGSTIRALKIAENDLMVIYQDSTQNATSPVSLTHAQSMLDYYRDYGKQVVDTYFGGTTDLNGDGKIVVLVSPVVEEGTAAFVWSGDFFPKTAQPGWAGCPASNQMELIRFSRAVIAGMSDGNYQALATVVHEGKHVSSLYKGLMRNDYQPLWVEEGTAEIAGEMSSRIAWAATGGPAVGARIRRADKVVSKESYGVLLRLARTIGYLGTQPNGILVTPVGANASHSVYGSGWHFHRWLGDAYGGATTPLADSSLFRALNDSLSVSGIPGIQARAGGKTWTLLLEEYAAAVLLNGTGASQPLRAFGTYDFPDITTGLLVNQRSGFYPWPVNVAGDQRTASFSTVNYSGSLGPGGMMAFDLTSDGTGLGLEVKVQGSTSQLRIVVVRVQ